MPKATAPARTRQVRAPKAPPAAAKPAPTVAAAEVVRDTATAEPRHPVTGKDAVTELPESAAAADAPPTAEPETVEDTAVIAASEAEFPTEDELVAIGLVDAPPAELTIEDTAAAIAELELIEELTIEQIDEAEADAEAAAAAAKAAARKKRSARSKLPVATKAPPASAPVVLSIAGLAKSYGATQAVSGIDLEVRTGSFYGIVGPNGAGKTTTLSMVTGLLRPDAGTVIVHDVDVWKEPAKAKRMTGVLPDRLRLFDRLTGAQLLYYSGVLRGLDAQTVRTRSADLVSAFGLDEAINRLVADYSAGMTKKIALACAMIHSPRLLVLDEPFEAVDPVSAANLIEILQRYVAAGGTVVLSSHGMDLIERVCDSVAIIVQGKVLASGTLDQVRDGERLEDRFVELAGGRKVAEGMEWLHSFSD